ncbi:MAG: hypothetical protein JST55_05300 [Bacteroidetes bacterium]|nr:hypothetical protein [Bacteroidota bacterium]
MKKRNKLYITLVIFTISLAIILFLYFKIREPFYLSFFRENEKSLNEFVTEIKNYKKIYGMTKNKTGNTLNDKHYTFKKEQADTSGKGRQVYYIEDLLKNLDIQQSTFEKFRTRMEKIKIDDFFVHDDVSISFGISSGRYGVIYDERNTSKWYNEPDYHRTKLSDNWYYWSF